MATVQFTGKGTAAASFTVVSSLSTSCVNSNVVYSLADADYFACVNNIWVSMTHGGGGSGTVTHTSGGLTNNQLVLGNGIGDVKTLGLFGTTTTVLHGNAAGAPTFSGVSLTADTLANQGTATTVLHGNAAGQPSFGAVALATDVSGQLPIGSGGTGQATQQTALDALMPGSPTAGDLVYWNGTHWVRLPGNTVGTQWLQETSSGVPSWTTPGGSGTVTNSLGTLTLGHVILGNGSADVKADANFDDGISAANTLTYAGTSGISATQYAATGAGAGNIKLFDTGGVNNVIVSAPGSVTSYTLTLPTTAGTANFFLQTNGSGTTTWAAGNAGTVTAIATTSPITGGTITSTGTIACATCTTSAAALTANQLIIGSGGQAEAALGSLGTTTTVLHGNAAGAPSFGAVALATDVSGTLPVGNGGTGTASTLVGVVRGGSPMTAAELSGVVITSGSNATTPGKIDVTNANAYCQAAGGSGTTYTCNLSPAITAYVTGTHYRFMADVANTGAATINFNAVGAISLKKAAGGITTALVANDLQAGQWIDIIYDGTNMQMQSLLGNAPGGGLSGLVTGTPQLAASTSTLGAWNRTVIVDGTVTTVIPSTPVTKTRYLITGDITQSSAITVSAANVTIECTPGSKITRSAATDLFDVTGNNFTLRNCVMDGGSQVTAGTGPLVTFGNATTAANDGLIIGNIFQNTGTSGSFQGTILIQNGNRNTVVENIYTGTQADFAISVFPLNAKNTTDTVIARNVVTGFNPGASSIDCIFAQDSNGGGASITGLRVENNTIYGRGSNAVLVHVQGTSIGQTAASPRNVNVSYNNLFFTGATFAGFKLFSFFNSRFQGNVIDDQTFANQDLVLLGDTYNSSFLGNTLRSQGSSTAPWLSTDEQGNTTSGNQIFGVPSATPGFEWVLQSGPLSNNNVTGNTVQLTSAVAGTCYQVLVGTTSFTADGNIFSSNNCVGTGTASQKGLELKTGVATGASNLLNTNILGNVFVNVPTGINITAVAQTAAGPATVRTINIGNNSFETVTTAINVVPTASSGGGATNISGMTVDGNSARSVTTFYSATPGTGNTISGTQLGNNSFDTVTTILSDTGTATLFNRGLQVVALTSDFTSGSGTTALQTITGLSFVLQANLAQTVTFECNLSYSQATNVSDQFGIQAATFAPTRIDARGWMGTSTTATTFGALANLTTTTATAIVTATPTVTTTNGVILSGTIQNPSNASAQTINIMLSQATAADVIVVKAGSSCSVRQ